MLLHRRELSLLEAYEGDGWQGGSKEKLKPKDEVVRARASVRVDEAPW